MTIIDVLNSLNNLHIQIQEHCQSVYYVIYRVVDMFRPRQEVHRDPQDLGPLHLADSHHRLIG